MTNGPETVDADALTNIGGGAAIPSFGDRARLANIDLQRALRRQQQAMQLMSNMERRLQGPVGS